MNEQFRKYFNDTSEADVVDDPDVVAARKQIADLTQRHREVSALIEPLRAVPAEIARQVAALRSEIDGLQVKGPSIAADVFAGVLPERAWRDHREQLAICCDKLEQLELAGPVFDGRIRDLSPLVGRISYRIGDASVALDKAINAARAVLAEQRMNA